MDQRSNWRHNGLQRSLPNHSPTNIDVIGLLPAGFTRAAAILAILALSACLWIWNLKPCDFKKFARFHKLAVSSSMGLLLSLLFLLKLSSFSFLSMLQRALERRSISKAGANSGQEPIWAQGSLISKTTGIPHCASCPHRNTVYFICNTVFW